MLQLILFAIFIRLVYSKSHRSLNPLNKPSANAQPDLSVAPEVAASVVRQYLLPLFEGEGSPRRSFRIRGGDCRSTVFARRGGD